MDSKPKPLIQAPLEVARHYLWRRDDRDRHPLRMAGSLPPERRGKLGVVDPGPDKSNRFWQFSGLSGLWLS